MKVTPRVWAITGAVVILVLAVGGFALWKQSTAQKTVGKIYAQVGSHKIDQAELDQTLKNSAGVSKSQAVTVLADCWLYYYMAKDNHISVSDKQVDEALKQTQAYYSNATNHNYLQVALRRNLYKDKLEQAVTGYSSGRFVVAHYDQNIPVQGGGRTPEEAARTPQQVQALEDSDKQYATAFINGLYAKLKAKKISFDQAVEAEKTDPRLGLTPLPTVFHSGLFNTADGSLTGNAIFTDTKIKDSLAKLKVGQFSSPVVGQVSTDLTNAGPLVDGYTVILQLDASSKQLTKYASFADMVSAYKSKLKYGINS